MFFTYYVGTENESAELNTGDNKWIGTLLYVVNLTINAVLPTIITAIANIIIIRNLKRSSESRNVRKTGQSHVENRHLARMLISVSAVFVVLCWPYTLNEIIINTPRVIAEYDLSAPYWQLRMNIIFWSLVLLSSSNQAVGSAHSGTAEHAPRRSGSSAAARTLDLRPRGRVTPPGFGYIPAAGPVLSLPITY